MGKRLVSGNVFRECSRRLTTPMNVPIPGLPEYEKSDQSKQGKGCLAPTHISTLENGLRVASQEAFGQYSTVGGK